MRAMSLGDCRLSPVQLKSLNARLDRGVIWQQQPLALVLLILRARQLGGKPQPHCVCLDRNEPEVEKIVHVSPE